MPGHKDPEGVIKADKDGKLFVEVVESKPAALSVEKPVVEEKPTNEMGIIIEEKVASIRDELQQTAEQIFNSMEFVGESEEEEHL